MTPRPNDNLLHGKLTEAIIGAFYYVYNQLGYGFLERAYVEALARVLRRLGYKVEREVYVPVYFEDNVICLQRLDLLVEQRVVVEAKASFALCEADHQQLFSYLHGTRIEVGLLLHFGPKPRFYRKIWTASVPPSNPDPPDQGRPGNP